MMMALSLTAACLVMWVSVSYLANPNFCFITFLEVRGCVCFLTKGRVFFVEHYLMAPLERGDVAGGRGYLCWRRGAAVEQRM